MLPNLIVNHRTCQRKRFYIWLRLSGQTGFLKQDFTPEHLLVFPSSPADKLL